MTVTLGQFIPGKSIFHSADPRTKILWTIAIMVFILLADTWVGYAISALFIFGCVAFSKVPVKMIIKSIKPVLFFLVFTIILNLIFYHGTTPLVSFWKITIYLESIDFSLKMVSRIILLVVGASLLTYTTTSVAITDGIESLMRPLAKIGFPAHDFALMMSIALRFIPTFADETDKIIKAQASRGAEFESGNLVTKVKSYIPVLVPLFVGAFKSADDMATAMEARCYRGGDGRTRFKVLKFSKSDLIILILTIVYGILIVLDRIFL